MNKSIKIGQCDVKPVRVFLTDGSSKTKAYVDILINDTFIVKGLRVIDAGNGLFVAFPANKAKNDKYYPIVYCNSYDLLQDVNNTVLKFYKSEAKETVTT